MNLAKSLTWRKVLFISRKLYTETETDAEKVFHLYQGNFKQKQKQKMFLLVKKALHRNRSRSRERFPLISRKLSAETETVAGNNFHLYQGNFKQKQKQEQKFFFTCIKETWNIIFKIFRCICFMVSIIRAPKMILSLELKN